ncbi:MAG: methyltransferase domain-containing protein [Acidiferrobacterales bacterium]
MAWDPTQYLKFDEPRLRPGLELIARIPADQPALIHDLGCGTGALTARLQARWPAAQVIGVDSSPEMLARAAADHPNIRWVEADVVDWRPERPPSILFSNATLHWVDDHEMIFPRLLGYLARGGWLAVQMPGNFDAPSHQLMYETVMEGPWRKKLAPLIRNRPVLSPDNYYSLLAPVAATVDIWATTYLHVLSGDDPVLEWVGGSASRPFLGVLTLEERRAFETQFAAKLRKAYLKRSDGKTLFPFRRLFIMARAHE